MPDEHTALAQALLALPHADAAAVLSDRLSAAASDKELRARRIHLLCLRDARDGTRWGPHEEEAVARLVGEAAELRHVAAALHAWAAMRFTIVLAMVLAPPGTSM